MLHRTQVPGLDRRRGTLSGPPNADRQNQLLTVMLSMRTNMGFIAAPGKVLLSEASHRQCRWIESRQGFGVFVICGRRVRHGSSFCAGHHDVVWGNRRDEQKPTTKVVHAA